MHCPSVLRQTCSLNFRPITVQGTVQICNFLTFTDLLSDQTSEWLFTWAEPLESALVCMIHSKKTLICAPCMCEPQHCAQNVTALVTCPMLTYSVYAEARHVIVMGLNPQEKPVVFLTSCEHLMSEVVRVQNCTTNDYSLQSYCRCKDSFAQICFIWVWQK